MSKNAVPRRTPLVTPGPLCRESVDHMAVFQLYSTYRTVVSRHPHWSRFAPVPLDRTTHSQWAKAECALRGWRVDAEPFLQFILDELRAVDWFLIDLCNPTRFRRYERHCYVRGLLPSPDSAPQVRDRSGRLLFQEKAS